MLSDNAYKLALVSQALELLNQTTWAADGIEKPASYAFGYLDDLLWELKDRQKLLEEDIQRE